MTTVVIDRNFLSDFDVALINEDWFENFEIPLNDKINRIDINNVIYFLSNDSDEKTGYLVIKADIFKDFVNRTRAFERIVRAALRHFDRNISIPISWQPYYLGRILSIYATSNKKKSARIYIDQKPSENSNNIYVFEITEKPEEINKVYHSIDMESYNLAISHIVDAALCAIERTEKKQSNIKSTELPSVGGFGILLNQQDFNFSEPGLLEDWLQYRLNENQLKFVTREVNQPIRLRGAAGTGKTRAMAVKCLNDLYRDSLNGGDKSFAFITHSSALSQELMVDIFSGLDPDKKWSRLIDSSNKNKLWIGTLYDLAQEHLNYAQKGLSPISSDGREGRLYQRIVIEESVNKIKSDPRIAITLLEKCPNILSVIQDKDSIGYNNFINDLMSEFTGVLEAENIRKGNPNAEKYLKASRSSWQAELPTLEHRKLAIEIYDVYCGILKSQKFMSLDQMIADYGTYLYSHEWGQLRESKGFDYIYIDEYHYFNSHESMLLHNLFKTRSNFDGRWPLIMAYDLKQNVSGSGLSGGIARFKNPGVGESIQMELSQNYRATPEIINFLMDVDSFFPALDLEGEYSTYDSTSEIKSGLAPSVTIFDSDIDLVENVFQNGIAAARELGSSKKVAILCLNEGIFDKYAQLAIVEKFVTIKTRDDLKATRYTRTRCVFSMPEYVAGLQFDTIFLIHADDVDFNTQHITPVMQREYISRFYLGASRASKTLVVASSLERGGPNEIIQLALKNGSILSRVNRG